MGWDRALLEIWEADIRSTLGVFFPLFHALAPAESSVPLLLAFSKSPTYFGVKIANWTEHPLAAVAFCPRLNWTCCLWTQLWRHDRLALITQSAAPLTIETSAMSVCQRSLPLFWEVKTIRHLYCPFPGWASTHPVYWKEFNRRQLGPYGAWSHPKSLVMIALFYTGCPHHAFSISLSTELKIVFFHCS